VRAGEQLGAHARASGQQIYVCDGSKWTLSAADAKLFDEAGRQVGSHFAGPTWQWSDGSRLTGRPIASVTPDPESIPWLLLTATGHTGDGAMKNVASIQRVQTKGGKAPLTAAVRLTKVTEREFLIQPIIISTCPALTKLTGAYALSCQ
jgi:hypothetical protein